MSQSGVISRRKTLKRRNPSSQIRSRQPFYGGAFPGATTTILYSREKPPGLGFQGREIKATIQAPTLKAQNAMIKGMRGYARRNGLGQVKVLSKGRDPDGGFEAIIAAHNTNPFEWLSRKIEERGGGWEKRTARAAVKEHRRNVKSKLKEAKLRREASLLRAQTELQQAKAEREEAVVRKKKAYMKRPKGYKKEKILAMGW